MYKKIILVYLLLLSASGFAQKTKSKSDAPDNSNMEKYLDDGRVPNVSNLIRFRAGVALTGYLGLSYERKLARKFGLEAGAYYKPFTGHFFESDRLDNGIVSGFGGKGLLSVNGGTAFLLYPKLYITGKKINNGYFFGLKTIYKSFKVDMFDDNGYTNNSFTQKNVQATSVGAILTAGSHQHVGSRFVFGVEWGLGVINDVYKDVNTTDYDTNTNKYVVVPTHQKMTVLSAAYNIDMVFGILF